MRKGAVKAPSEFTLIYHNCFLSYIILQILLSWWTQVLPYKRLKGLLFVLFSYL